MTAFLTAVTSLDWTLLHADCPRQRGPEVPRACSTVLPPLQRSNTGPEVPRARSTVLPPLQRSNTGPEVPRARSKVLPPLQRIKTGPQSPEYAIQLCPLFREPRQDHSHQSTFYSSAPSSQKQEGSSGLMEQRYKNSCGATRRTF